MLYSMWFAVISGFFMLAAYPSDQTMPQPRSVSKTEIDNDRVIVRRNIHPAHSTTEMHSHRDGIVVYLSDVHERTIAPDGSFRAVVPTPAGQSILTVSVTAGAHATGWAQQTVTAN